MKKTLALALALLLLSGMLCGSFAEGTDVMDRFLTDWVTLLMMQDNRYTQENYALQAVIDYHENPSWENLVRARTAVVYTCTLVEQYAHMEAKQTMSDADYEVLVKQGMDVADVQTEFEMYNNATLASLQEVDVHTWNGKYKAHLMEFAFDRYTVEQLAFDARLRLKYNDYLMKLLYLTNNYISLELPPEAAQKLDHLASINAPGVMSVYDQAFTTINDVINEIVRVQQLYEDANIEYEASIAMSEVDLETVQERIDKGESKSSAEDLIKIGDLPALQLPWSPLWDGEAMTFLYYWKNADGSVTPPVERMVMDSIPNCMSATVPNTSLDEYKAYVVELLQIGLTPADMSDSATSFTFEDGTSLLISWSEKNEMLVSVNEGQICFIPYSYMAE